MKALQISLVALLIALGSCTNLKEVHTYSSDALKSVERFEEIESTFSSLCLDKCFLEQLSKLRLRQGSCNCEMEKAADSVTFILYSVIRAYFDGLANLSNSKAVTYNFAKVTKSLTEWKFGDLTVSKQEAEACSKLSSILLGAITDGYRKKKIRQFIADANEPVQTLLRYLSLNLNGNLSGKLRVQRLGLENYYFNLIEDSTLSNFERRLVIKEYTAKALEINNKQAKIATYGKALDRIAVGHQELYNNRDRLNLNQAKELISGYASDIKSIMGEFNKLNKHD